MLCTLTDLTPSKLYDKPKRIESPQDKRARREQREDNACNVVMSIFSLIFIGIIISAIWITFNG